FYGALGGETPISYGAISRYAGDHGIAGDDFADLLHFVQALDAEWLQHLASKAKNREAGA
ncbi:hypothetical protein, partial [Sinorhizobium meliloti]|uniref:hypothetical protein n=1 Tax=Rhizobium meliloti TaxID=382 RepID=UPI003989883B